MKSSELMLSNNKKEYYRNLISHIGYIKDENNENVYIKKYSSCKDLVITVNFDSEKIDYPSSILKGDETTSNFASSENFVVLECVDRLLEKGYAPKDIELEKKWTLGRQTKGKLDILVKAKDIAFLMIECKTWDIEYEKAVRNTQQMPQKSQLLSYYQQDQKAEYVCYYTSRFQNGTVEYKTSIIETKDYSSLASLEETAQRWNKQYKNNGIFEADILPYKYEPKSITELKDIQSDDSGIIFNQFAEILRHHVVSDKSNAFNKIFNLFLCKLVDEEKHTRGEEYLFQVNENDTDETLLLRLNDLYKDGMKEFLDKEITDFRKDQYNGWDEDTKNAFDKLRLHKNNEFAFVEVYDEESFKENSKIVREVVELLQPYRLKYSNKHQVLGDFFELLLNTGLKQESGQFFTPIPITRFMLLSLGMEDIIAKKIQKGESNFLPYVIDFAMGSGHFLTEAMDIIDIILKKYSLNGLRNNIMTEIKKAKDYPFGWANEYIYGIEKDYRLVKTAKISCFLHGDGLANILHGDGLSPYDDKTYKNKLQFKSPKNNHNFDVLVANPPYSVQAFKAVMNHGSDNFDLYDSLTDNSSEIEALFIERMNHLLKEDGVAGIILPISILSNAGIYNKARAIILQSFEILGITALDSKAFMATGTNTVILFLRKRKDSIIRHVEREVKEYIEKQVVTEGIQSYLYFRGLSEEIDKEKLITYLLTYKTKTIVSKTGEKEEAVKFRGYDFSNRRGNEGINIIKQNGKFESMLYDEDNWDNPDKLVALYRMHFRGEDINIPDSLKNNSFICNTYTLLNWDSSNWRSLRISKRKKIISKYSVIRLKDNIVYCSGTRPEGGVSKYKSGAISLGGEQVSREGTLNLSNIPYVPLEFYKNCAEKTHIKTNDILICKDGALTGKVAFVRGNEFSQKEVMINEHLYVVRSTEIAITQKYLFYYLFTDEIFNYIQSISQKSAQEGYNNESLENTEIPIPPVEEQNHIVALMQAQDSIIIESRKRITELEANIKGIDLSGYSVRSIKEIMTLEYGISLPKHKRIEGIYPVIGSNGIIGYHNQYLITPPCVVIGRKGSSGEVNWYNIPVTPIDTTFYVHPLENNILKYLYYVLRSQNLQQHKTGSGPKGINREVIYELKIPLPSIEEQQKIVSKIDSYEKQIEELNNKINEAKNRQAEIMKGIFTVEDAD